VMCTLTTRFIFISYTVALPHLPSFPTRRSSDLADGAAPGGDRRLGAPRDLGPAGGGRLRAPHRLREPGKPAARARVDAAARVRRSEEHTSELQSRENLVCRLLLEKKKNKKET